MIDVTWMPYACVSKSVQALTDEQIESAWNAAYHTLRTLLGCRNPVQSLNLKLWRGYEIALANYCESILQEILDRDLQMTYSHVLFGALIEDAPRIQAYEKRFKVRTVEIPPELLLANTRKLSESRLLPKWFGWKPLHESHRYALKSDDSSELIWPWSERATQEKPRRIALASSTPAATRRIVANTSGKTRRYYGRDNRRRQTSTG